MWKSWILCLFVASLALPESVAAQIQFGSPYSNDKWMRDQKSYREQAEREKRLEDIGRVPAPASEPPMEAPVEEADSDDDSALESEPEETLAGELDGEVADDSGDEEDSADADSEE